MAADPEKQQKATTALSPAKQAQLAKEQEEREHQRVEQLVVAIRKKKYRAPLRDVQCSSERDACLECYRDEKSNVLNCKDVADAFVHCARQHTEVRMLMHLQAVLLVCVRCRRCSEQIVFVDGRPLWARTEMSCYLRRNNKRECRCALVNGSIASPPIFLEQPADSKKSDSDATKAC